MEVLLGLDISPPGVDEREDANAAAESDGRGLWSDRGLRRLPPVRESGGLDGASGGEQSGLGRDRITTATEARIFFILTKHNDFLKKNTSHGKFLK